jgi:hypothetical protein
MIVADVTRGDSRTRGTQVSRRLRARNYSRIPANQPFTCVTYITFSCIFQGFHARFDARPCRGRANSRWSCVEYSTARCAPLIKHRQTVFLWLDGSDGQQRVGRQLSADAVLSLIHDRCCDPLRRDFLHTAEVLTNCSPERRARQALPRCSAMSSGLPNPSYHALPTIESHARSKLKEIRSTYDAAT